MLDGYLEMSSVMDKIGKVMGTVILLCNPTTSARKSRRRGAGCNSERN